MGVWVPSQVPVDNFPTSVWSCISSTKYSFCVSESRVLLVPVRLGFPEAMTSCSLISSGVMRDVLRRTGFFRSSLRSLALFACCLGLSAHPFSAKEPFLISPRVGALLDASAAAAQAPNGISALIASCVAWPMLAAILRVVVGILFQEVFARCNGGELSRGDEPGGFENILEGFTLTDRIAASNEPKLDRGGLVPGQ